MPETYSSVTETLAIREQYREQYLRHRDPIAEDRMLWRAQSFRHLIHLLPGQTILELGCGQGIFTRQLASVSRGENPITAISFDSSMSRPADLPGRVEFLSAECFPGPLEGRRFDFVVAIDLLDRRNCVPVLQNAYDFLNPGGQVVFHQAEETGNPMQLLAIVNH